MMFQASDGKGKQFLDLVDNNLNIIEPVYTKGGSWLQAFGHSNSLCACATRAITNHTPCYELRSLGLDNRTTLVLSNTRELDRVSSTE